MNVRWINDKEAVFDRPVLTIGTFDGVHCGHLEVLRTLSRRAAERNRKSLVISFDVPPRLVLQPNLPTRILSSIDEKTERIARAGIDNLLLIPFTLDFAALSPEEFTRKYLYEHLHASEVILGYDHMFGKNGSGGYEMMKQLGPLYDFEVQQVKPRLCNGTLVSSSLIRRLLETGETESAASYLGYPYSITGKVILGNQLGRTIGFPTLNIEPLDPLKILPGKGVYSMKAEIGGKTYPAMGNIGSRPTVDPDNPVLNLEVHVLDFNSEIYNETVRVSFGVKIRDEIRFSGLDELKNQLEKDKQRIRNNTQFHEI